MRAILRLTFPKAGEQNEFGRRVVREGDPGAQSREGLFNDRHGIGQHAENLTAWRRGAGRWRAVPQGP